MMEVVWIDGKIGDRHVYTSAKLVLSMASVITALLLDDQHLSQRFVCSSISVNSN